MLVPAGPLSSEDALPMTATSSLFLAIARATLGRAKSGATVPAAMMHSLPSLATATLALRAHSTAATTIGLIPLLPRGWRLADQVAIEDFVLLCLCTTKSGRLS